MFKMDETVSFMDINYSKTQHNMCFELLVVEFIAKNRSITVYFWLFESHGESFQLT